MKHLCAVFFLLGMFLILLSCEEEQICDENTRTYLNAGFYKAGSGELQDSVLNNLKIRAIGSDSLLYDSSKISSIKLPLDYKSEQTRYIMINDSVVDTLAFNYTAKMVFISYHCGFVPEYDLVSMGHTSNGIDSVIIIKSKIENLDEENMHIYL